MKKTLSAFLLLTFLVIVTNAQVAINNVSNPADASAMLDVSSNNKGLLIPRVYISSGTPSAVIPNAAHGLMVFNINNSFSKGEGLYYNAAYPPTVDWRPVSDLVFPYYKSSADNGAMFRIDNYSQNINSSAVHVLSGAGTALFAETVNGYALQTKGKINIAGGSQTPGQGKVLTSDANGNATWEGAIAFLASGIQGGGALEVPVDGKKVPYLSEIYDYGNNFNPSNISPHSTFTVPVKGIYHFDAAICFNVNLSGVVTSIELMRVRNGQEVSLRDHSIKKESGWIGNQLSYDCELIPGDQVYIKASATGGSTQLLSTPHQMNSFSGRLVMRLN